MNISMVTQERVISCYGLPWRETSGCVISKDTPSTKRSFLFHPHVFFSTYLTRCSSVESVPPRPCFYTTTFPHLWTTESAMASRAIGACTPGLHRAMVPGLTNMSSLAFRSSVVKSCQAKLFVSGPVGRKACGKRLVCPRAMQADDYPSSEMTFESALDLLGVKEGASFDDILRAKKAILEKNSGNEELLIQVS